jgi:hypothetical protein
MKQKLVGKKLGRGPSLPKTNTYHIVYWQDFSRFPLFKRPNVLCPNT